MTSLILDRPGRLAIALRFLGSVMTRGGRLLFGVVYHRIFLAADQGAGLTIELTLDESLKPIEDTALSW